MTNGGSSPVSRTGADTSRFTVRRLRSAFFLWRGSIRRIDVTIAIILAGLSIALGGYLFVRAQSDARLAFAEQAQRFQKAITDKLEQPSRDLETVARFIEASDHVTRRQFALFVDPMLLNPSPIYALEWLPVVADAERAGYEAEAHAAGLTDYRFWDLDRDGRRQTAERRESYVPIHYMEPPNAGALGFDVTSSPTRRVTANKARDSGRLITSPPFGLIEDAGSKGSPPAVALYKALYKGGDPDSQAARRTSLAGFVLAIFRVAPLVDRAASTAGEGLGYTLRDLGEGASPLMAERPRNSASVARRSGFGQVFDVRVRDADQAWSLEVFAMPGAFLPQKRTAFETTAVGVLTAMLFLLAATSVRTITRLRRQVAKVGPYRLIARLGRGAMGVVWEARHALLRRPTAVKLLAPGTEGERAVARFEREVQLTAGLTHPSTIAIYDYGRTADGVFYYAMELLHGINLGQLVAFDGPQPPGRVVHLLRQACGALTEAHAAGLIHRDIKPANMMLCVYGGIPDFVKLLDFGLVKAIGDVEHAGEGSPGGHDAALSQDGSLLGTPLYMAPEGMSDSSKVDARADLFALGAVGYFLLTGKSPFPGRTAIEVFALERQGPPPPLSSAAPGPVPAPLEETLWRCLAFEPSVRPASAEELDAMLEACAVAPAWTIADARAWWRQRGPGALKAAAADREDHEARGQYLMLSSDTVSRSVRSD